MLPAVLPAVWVAVSWARGQSPWKTCCHSAASMLQKTTEEEHIVCQGYHVRRLLFNTRRASQVTALTQRFNWPPAWSLASIGSEQSTASGNNGPRQLCRRARASRWSSCRSCRKTASHRMVSSTPVQSRTWRRGAWNSTVLVSS